MIEQDIATAIAAGQRWQIILADPPWRFATYSAKGEGKSPQKHYACRTIEEICALQVAQVADKNAVLLIWCTWPTIFSAEKVIKAWGFKYSGLAWEWIKRNPETRKYPMGGGYGTRKNLEPCLLARRGSPKLYSRSERDFIFAKRREHSRKPDEQYARIERMYRGPKLEMFARQVWHGWDAFGDQIELFRPEARLPGIAA